jgi:signal transduction histidine kinase
MRGRPWSWIIGRPRLTDGLVVGFVFVTGCVGLIGGLTRHSVIAAGLVGVLLQASALVWRRSHPLAVFLVVVLVEVARTLINPDGEPSGLALPFAAFAVSVYGGSRVRLAVAASAIAVILMAVTFLVLGDFQTSRRLIPAGALTLVAWVIGDYQRSRRQFFVELVSRHQQARAQATDDERLRIARELHDVVAHNVSVMAIQAGAARVSGAPSAEALQSIEVTARDTLSELNHLLGVLRKDSDAPRRPQPGLDHAEALLKPARDAGLEASLKVTGEPRPLPAALDLSAYRIVQEGITNALKHSNATRLEVLIDHQPDAIVLTITDNGRGATEKLGDSTGHGLIGMRERVELFGGRLGTGSSSLGGFTVRATLPIK